MEKIILTTMEELQSLIEDAVMKMPTAPDPDADVLRGDQELAGFMGCSKVSIWKFKRQGLPFYAMGKVYLYKKSEILDWMRVNAEAVKKYLQGCQ